MPQSIYRFLTLLIILVAASFCAHAKHITGGEIIYDYLGPGTAANSKNYRITLRLFRDDNCFSCAEMPGYVIIGIFNNGSSSLVTSRTVQLGSSEKLPLNTLPSCITNPPLLQYTMGSYSFTIDLENNPAGYIVAFQTCCRIDGIENIPNNVGATYIAVIPGTSVLGVTEGDNSPRFSQGISVICYNKPFTLDFSAEDPDGDLLLYSFCDGFNGGGTMNANPVLPENPPYQPLQYTGIYSGANPLGLQASIDPNTGIISGIAPDAGRYVVSVCVQSLDKNTGVMKTRHRKDFIVSVAPCDFAGAQLKPSYLTCDGFNFTFENLNTSPLNQTFRWEFGDGNFSTDASPTHTYAAAGTYNLKLVVNPGGSCSDSTVSKLNVYPGFYPSFTDNAPMCKTVPVTFNDATGANYGAVNFWKWDFGIAGTTTDVSTVKNPQFVYATPGNYDVTLIVGSDKGCLDTIVKTIQITDKAPLAVSTDTLICSIDTLQLRAVSSVMGNITWSPNYMISDVNSFTPLVSPDVTTTYTAYFADTYGCTATVPVKVSVVNAVTLLTMGDTTICRTDSVRLNTISDALYYNWTPSLMLNDPKLQSPVAAPLAVSTTYRVFASIGKCSATDEVVVHTVPYPLANAGSDSTICFGNSIQLQASGGSIYQWSPGRYLSSSNIENPVVQKPRSTIKYIVEVRDILGCPKPVLDSIIVSVVKIEAEAGPTDTSIVLGQPLQLNATGSDFYQWTPGTWLNNPNILNPLAQPLDNITYAVRVSNKEGCFDVDSINVKVFKIDPDLLVPTGFSPNADGSNDIFRPIAIGMKSLDVFKVYNRWGQLLYSSTKIGDGWDGRFKGNEQAPGTYVWQAEGTNYLGKKIKRKGTVILIR